MPNTRNRSIREHIRSLWDYPEIDELDAKRLSLLFRECRFEAPVFRNCAVQHTNFDNSAFEDPTSDASVYKNVHGKDQWWLNVPDTRTPTSAYVEELQRLIGQQLDESSWSRARLSRFLEAYKGENIKSAWFADLVDNGIPDDEYEIVESIVDQLSRRFPA